MHRATDGNKSVMYVFPPLARRNIFLRRRDLIDLIAESLSLRLSV